MNVPSSVKSSWEHRFPELSGNWTHWRLFGDGVEIGSFPGERLGDALRLIEQSCLSYSSIICRRAVVDAHGCFLSTDDLVTEISNIRNDQLRHHQVTSNEKLQQEFLALEMALLQPSTRKDPRQLEQMLTEDFVEVGSLGAAFTRAEIIAALARESPTQWTVDNLDARPLADGVVLVTYRAISVRHGERVASLRASIWKREAGRWRMAFHQGTLARD